MELLNPLTDTSFAAKSVAYTGTAGTTGTFSTGCDGVLVWSTSDAYIKVGAGVTATTNDCPIPAYTPIPFKVPFDEKPWVVSAIQVSAAGTVYAKPMQSK